MSDREYQPYELLKEVDLPLVAPAVSSGALAFHESWYAFDDHPPDDGKQPSCPKTEPYPSFAYYKDGKVVFGCSDKVRKLYVVCVSAAGILPSLRDPSLLVPPKKK